MTDHITDDNTPLTIAELLPRLAERGIRLTQSNAYRLIGSGCIPATRIGGRYRTTVAAVVAVMTPAVAQ